MRADVGECPDVLYGDFAALCEAAHGNVLLWSRAAGVGDLVVVLAQGMIEFGGRPFSVVCGRLSPHLIQEYRNQIRLYQDICDAFPLCEQLIVLNCSDEEAVAVHVRHALESGHIVRIVEDFGWRNHREHIWDIRRDFQRYFQPQIDKTLSRLLRPGVLNICFQLRWYAIDKLTLPVPMKEQFLARNVNLVKWKDFLTDLAQRPDINLIGIGQSNPQSPSYLGREFFGDLAQRSNVHLPFLEPGTSLQEDAFFINACDLFIGSHSGPWVLASFLNKPLLVFDYGFDRRSIQQNFMELADQQKVFFGVQSGERMRELFTRYLETYFSQGRFIPPDRRAVVAESAPAGAAWPENTRSLDAAFYRQARQELAQGGGSRAELLLEQSFDYVQVNDVYQFFQIGALFARSGAPDPAIRYFLRAMEWAEPDHLAPKVMLSIHYHLAELYEQRGDWSLAERHLHECLKKERHCLPALAGLSRLWQRRGDSARAQSYLRRARQLTAAGAGG